MKKTVCLILSLIMMLTLGLSAAADETSEQLKKVTLKVKETLGIGDDYKSFTGNSYVYGSQTWWNLSWDNENESLYVTCDDNGKVYGFDHSHYEEDIGNNGTSLHFPSFGYEDACRAAEQFLSRVLEEGEGWVFREQQDTLRDYGNYSLLATLTLNGVETEMSIYLSFLTADGSLRSFWRDDARIFFTGGVPSHVPSLSGEEAISALRSAVTTDLEWSYSNDENHEARLRYTVSLPGNTIVDAQTGELLDRWNGGIVYNTNEMGSMPEEAPEPAADKGLTPQEISGAEKYDGVLDSASLKAAVVSVAALGITENYEMSAVNYTAAQPGMDPDDLPEDEEIDDTVTATYRLSRTLSGPEYGLTQEEYDELVAAGNVPTVYKNVSADARTGEIKSLYTFYNGFGWEEVTAEESPVISDIALGFLTERYGSYLPLCELTDASQNTRGVDVNFFTYTRMEAGYRCPMNQISISVNASTGFVDYFSCVWDEELSFGPSGPVVGEETAIDSFLAIYDAKLCYVSMPEDADNWESARSWLLVYLPDAGSGWVAGVDAITGVAEYSEWIGEFSTPEYCDIADSYARQEIGKLAAYGVGYYGVNEFRPTATVTELDMILLMLSCSGWKEDYSLMIDADEAELLPIYNAAYRQGFLSTYDQNPDREVSRSELCRCFVNLSGLGEAAELRGIYICGFTDESEIPVEDLGYIAIAKGLGVVQGDRNGEFRPNAGATRQELAIMLYRYLSR